MDKEDVEERWTALENNEINEYNNNNIVPKKITVALRPTKS